MCQCGLGTEHSRRKFYWGFCRGFCNAKRHQSHQALAMIGLAAGSRWSGTCRRAAEHRLVENPDEIDHAVLSGAVDLRLAGQSRPSGRQAGRARTGVSHLPRGQREDPRRTRSSKAATSSRRRSPARTAPSLSPVQAAHDAEYVYFRFQWKIAPETRRAHARLRALRRQAMEMVRARPQRQSGAGGRTAGALRRSLLDHA